MKKPNPMGYLWRFSRGDRLLYISSMLFMVLAILANYLVPQVIRYAADSAVAGLPVDIPLLAVAVLAVTALGGGFGFVRGRCVAVSSERLVKRLRDKLFSHIQTLPYEWHVRIQTGDIIQRCTSDVDIVRDFVQNRLAEIANTLMLVVAGYAILFSMNVTMALVSFAFLPVMWCYSIMFLKKISQRFLKADEAEGQLLSVAQENLTGVRVVRAFGRERREIDRFDKQNRHLAELCLKLGDLLCMFWGANDMLTYSQILALCVCAVFQSIAGNLTVGDFIVFMSYNAMLIWPVRGLGRSLSEAGKARVSLGRLIEILEEPPEQDAAGSIEPDLNGDIVFENVSFAYPGEAGGGEPVLRGVSFTVEKGKTLGVLGGTGSGKTTAAALLCRLYDLGEGDGRITIGGVDIRRIKRAWLRRNIGIVLQEPFLFSRTIGENIAALSKEHSAESIARAARISRIDDSVERFAQGFDTIVGERGVTLSGGEKQRVAIARAILNNPPIMVFDDSLSAVDTETDTKIRAALGEMTHGVTTIIIAHRITSISKADKILVLEKGSVAEMGTHAELLRQDGIYRRVYDLQSSIEDELAEEGERA